MTWIGMLAVAVVVVALVALSGARLRGSRPVGGTQLMTVGRIVAIILVLVLAYVAFGR